MTEVFKHHYEHCLKHTTLDRGVTTAQLGKLLAKTENTIKKLNTQQCDNTLPLLNIANKREDIAQLRDVAARISDRFDRLIVSGMGGSATNPEALVALRPWRPGTPKIDFISNVDPYSIDCLLKEINPKTTAFLMISKSGTTLETTSLTNVFTNFMRERVGQEKVGGHFFFITDPADNPLRRVGQVIGSTIINHEPIGGRFSALSNVGLLASAVAGLDIVALREGAREVVSDTLISTASKPSQAVVGAALCKGLFENGFPVAVLMPYIDRLNHYASWHRQTWAESLGKKGSSTTFIRASGAQDQHSQLQLYLDGAHDKFFTFIAADTIGKGQNASPGFITEPSLQYLNGKTLGDIIDAEQRGTAGTLVQHGCPVREIRIRDADEYAIGALMMFAMLEIIILADLMDINAFDQPAVEHSKILTRKLLNQSEMVA